MIKLVFIIVFVILLSAFLGYLGVTGYLTQFYNILSFLPTFLTPFISIYNVVITYNSTMFIILIWLGAHFIRYVLGKMGVYGE